MSGVESIMKLDIVVVGANAVSSSDDAYFPSALVPYEVSCFYHGFSNSLRSLV